MKLKRHFDAGFIDQEILLVIDVLLASGEMRSLATSPV